MLSPNQHNIVLNTPKAILTEVNKVGRSWIQLPDNCIFHGPGIWLADDFILQGPGIDHFVLQGPGIDHFVLQGRGIDHFVLQGPGIDPLFTKGCTPPTCSSI